MYKEDKGHGITEESKKFLEKNLKDFKKIRRVFLNAKDEKHPVWIFMESDQFRVSGFSWGYGGERPHGLLWLFEKWGCPFKIDKISEWNKDHLYVIEKIKKNWKVTEKGRWRDGLLRKKRRWFE